MFTLTDDLETEIEIEGKTYPLDLSFDVVLRVYDLMQDEYWFDYEKINMAFTMLVKCKDNYAFDIKYETVRYIMDNMVNDHDESEGNHGAPSKVFHDFAQDADYIYASFMQEYGIDLLEMKGKLRWEKFIALLTGLRDKTKFKEIIGIRSADLPTGKHMADERKRLKELKEIYALKKDRKTKDEELNNMFNMLIGGK